MCFVVISRSLAPAGISTVLCDNQNKAETLLQICEKGQTSVLKTVIVMDSLGSELVERGSKCGVDVVSMQDVEVLDNAELIVYTGFTPQNEHLAFPPSLNLIKIVILVAIQAKGKSNLQKPVVSVCVHFQEVCGGARF